MNVEFFSLKENLYSFRYRNQEATKENITQWAIYYSDYELSENELKILYAYLNEGEEKGDEVYQKIIEEEFSELSIEERHDKFFEFYQKGFSEPMILDGVRNNSILLDKAIEKNDLNFLLRLMDDIGLDGVAEYINQNASGKDTIKDIISDRCGPELLNRFLPLLENDGERAEIIINSVITNSEKGGLLPNIDNAYYRVQIVRATSTGSDNYTKEELIENIRNYETYKTTLDSFETEEEKTEYIKSLDDFDLRVIFLDEIQGKENRESIVNSLTCSIESEIEPQAKLVQQMITEFFEDKLGDKFDESKRERLQIAFNKTDVSFNKLEGTQNGWANFMLDQIIIHSRHEKNLNKTISFLIHEYGHILSQERYKTTRYTLPSDLDEGMQDVFSELVINHYLEKHKAIEVDGKKVRMEYPYVSYSGYKNENMWMRSILAPLEKDGTDIEALAEFQIGDKTKYLELAYGMEKAQNVEKDEFGNPDINTSFSEIYRTHEKGTYSELDPNSTYLRRNKLIPLLQLQDWIGLKRQNILGGGKYTVTGIADILFGDKKIYDIPREDLQKLVDLFYGQDNLNVIEYGNFANEKTRELTNDEIDHHSFEILNASTALWSRLEKAGTSIERVWGRALTREIEKVEQRQDLGTSIDKYKAIIPDLINVISRGKTNENEYVFDRIKDLQFVYLEQIEQAIQDGHAEEVINGLTDKKTGKMFIDSRNK